MSSETWTVYKKTKHRLGFRRPDGDEFRLPRTLLPDRFSVDVGVVCEWEREGDVAKLNFDLAAEDDPSIAGQIGQTPEVEVQAEPDRWVVWKVTSDRVGVTGATGKLKETGKFKIPPDLLPRDCQSGDFLYVQSAISPNRAGWVVLLKENKTRERQELLRLVE